MVIREAVNNDIEFIAEVCRDVAPLYESFIPGAFEKQACRYENDGLPSSYKIEIIEDKSESIGFCAYIKLSEDSWFLVALYVLSKYRGKGYGKEVMDAYIQRARMAEGKRMLLLVHKNAEWAIKFYKRYGYDEIADTMDGVVAFEPLLDKLYIKNTILLGYKID